ncbi:hypothetical protein ONS95_014900 [Cadophora gregata]|uniref:uncharacterized protein n=1 Tax=Cadophora gregata TaxID=51156 RepID=UPI0026DD8CD0|nr:uncharacterized protein ONS95_014900 [Cadophora gregata]KAK0113205.1 hypothetical protein ONS95_014900 [Cadophora gregata]KAK0125247.1 hypothetical protein ONS96_009103 [Cadophora gregata f. sp. sojae]
MGKTLHIRDFHYKFRKRLTSCWFHMARLNPTILALLLASALSTGSPTTFSAAKYTKTRPQIQHCFCRTTHYGLFCGSRTEDAAGASGVPAMLSGHCVPNYVYRCNGSAVSPAKIQVYCGLCKRSVDGAFGTDRCYE